MGYVEYTTTQREGEVRAGWCKNKRAAMIRAKATYLSEIGIQRIRVVDEKTGKELYAKSWQEAHAERQKAKEKQQRKKRHIAGGDGPLELRKLFGMPED